MNEFSIIKLRLNTYFRIDDFDASTIGRLFEEIVSNYRSLLLLEMNSTFATFVNSSVSFIWRVILFELFQYKLKF